MEKTDRAERAPQQFRGLLQIEGHPTRRGLDGIDLAPRSGRKIWISLGIAALIGVVAAWRLLG
jgi:hypothetical protein